MRTECPEWNTDKRRVAWTVREKQHKKQSSLERWKKSQKSFFNHFYFEEIQVIKSMLMGF